MAFVTYRTIHMQLRCERLGLRALAAHANRALRTLSARRTAATVYDAVRATLRTATRNDLGSVMRNVVATRPGWTQFAERDFLYTFGTRSATMSIPYACDTNELACLIARIEVKVLLGDSDPDVLMNFQMLASRELQQLAARDR